MCYESPVLCPLLLLYMLIMIQYTSGYIVGNLAAMLHYCHCKLINCPYFSSQQIHCSSYFNKRCVKTKKKAAVVSVVNRIASPKDLRQLTTLNSLKKLILTTFVLCLIMLFLTTFICLCKEMSINRVKFHFK